MTDGNSQVLKVDDIPVVENDELKKVITAAGLGNAIEWFDFGVYGFLLITLSRVFFPGADPGVALIASMATFSVPFLFRPLGGAFFGFIGDKYGRKRVLSFTIILMSLSTFAIGLIPSYATIGIWAPVLLLLAKVVQGLSVGGEYSGAVVFVCEYSPDKKRGFLASWLDFGSISGFLLGSIVVYLVTWIVGESAMASWGWRLPFLLSLPLGAIGLYLRRQLDESPAYEAQEDNDRDKTSSLKEIIRKNYKGIILCCALVILMNTSYYMLLTFMPSYLEVNLHYNESHSKLIIMFVMTFMLLIQPLVGFLSDRVGRRIFLISGALAQFFLAIPAYWMIAHDNMWLLAAGLAILALILCCFTGVVASVLPALFPTQVRFRTLAVTFNISVVIAGLTPTVATWLVTAAEPLSRTLSLYIPAVYLMITALCGLFAGAIMRETANRPLKDSLPIVSSRTEAREVLEEHFDHIEKRVEAIENKISELEEKRQNLVDQHPRLN